MFVWKWNAKTVLGKSLQDLFKMKTKQEEIHKNTEICICRNVLHDIYIFVKLLKGVKVCETCIFDKGFIHCWLWMCQEFYLKARVLCRIVCNVVSVFSVWLVLCQTIVIELGLSKWGPYRRINLSSLFHSIWKKWGRFILALQHLYPDWLLWWWRVKFSTGHVKSIASKGIDPVIKNGSRQGQVSIQIFSMKFHKWLIT